MISFENVAQIAEEMARRAWLEICPNVEGYIEGYLEDGYTKEDLLDTIENDSITWAYQEPFKRIEVQFCQYRTFTMKLPDMIEFNSVQSTHCFSPVYKNYIRDRVMETICEVDAMLRDLESVDEQFFLHDEINEAIDSEIDDYQRAQ